MSEPETPAPLRGTPPPTPTDAPVAAPGPRAARGGWPMVAAVVVVGAVAIWTALALGRVKDETGRRLAEFEQRARSSQEAAQRAEAEARAATQKLAVLENQLAEEQGQRSALEELYAELSRGRDDAALIEVERLVGIAAQELQLGGNLNAALAALQTADLRLARLDNARFVPLRRALARDIDKLKAAPTVDVTGLSLKLDTLAQSVETWPLLVDARLPAPAAPAPKPAAGAQPASPGVLDGAAGQWARVRAWLIAEFGDLVRIREVDTPEALLISPAQQRLLRQELRLRLLDARLALLARNDRVLRADLAEAEALITRYFDVRQAPVATAQAQVRSLAKTAMTVEAPTITDSVAAVRQLRGAAR